MKKPILEIQNFTKYYGNILAVKNLNLSLEEGEVFGFIGPNGAGKSTTIRSVMNFINKTEGNVYFEGKELTRDNISLKEEIGYLPSEVNLYEDFTVKEMLDFHESFYKKNIHKKRVELVKKLKIDESKKIEDLSFGNLKKVGIVLAFMHEPRLLILDEPTSGLDPIMQQVFFDMIKEEKKKGTTVFYSTHILSEISKICDRVGIIKEGELLNVQTIEELQEKNQVYVVIESKDCEKIIKDFKLDNVSVENSSIRFQSPFSSNELIQKLSKYNIQKILIEEATLEDIFLHYYE